MELLADVFGVDEVAEASSVALALVVLPALGLPEVGDGAVFNHYLLLIVELALHRHEALLSLLLGREFNVDVAQHVLANVVSDHDV